jgi:hypothetical protein
MPIASAPAPRKAQVAGAERTRAATAGTARLAREVLVT